MALKSKTREINIRESEGAFSIFKKTSVDKDEYDFSGLIALRQLLNNEKARILHAIKTQNPQSVYQLAKILNRKFKSVNEDIKLLERFGLVELIEEKTKNRKRHRPILVSDSLTIHLKI